MQRSIRVNVKKERYTSREELLEGRFNVKLDIAAQVTEDSYLVSSSSVSELPAKAEPIKRSEAAITNFFEGKLSVEALFHQVPSAFRLQQQLRGVLPRLSGRPTLFGSSMKGAVRSRIEYRLKPYSVGGAYYSLSCYAAQNPQLDLKFARNHLKLWGEESGLQRDWVCQPPDVCKVCDIFGAPSLGSRVSFSDYVLTEGETIRLSEFEGLEALKPNSTLRGAITCLNFSLEELGLLFIGLELHSNSPILIGKGKYRYLKKLGKPQLRGRFSLGKLVLRLEGFTEHLSNQLRGVEPNRLKEEALNALKASGLGKRLDPNLGAV